MIKNWILSHKIISVIALALLVFAGYKIVSAVTGGVAAPRYIFGTVQRGTIATTISGSGQVSSENQRDIKSKASGDITKIYVKAGQAVKAGTLLAEIDSSNAGISLESAKIAYEKLTKPADPADVSASLENVSKAYNDAWNDVSSVFVDLPSVLSGTDAIFYSQSGYLGVTMSAKRSAVARANTQDAGLSFDEVKTRSQVVLLEYNSLSRLSATSSVDLLLGDTYDLLKKTSEALKNTQNAISYIVQSEPDTSSSATTAANNTNNWLNSVNSHLTTILSDENAITSNEKALADLVKGADPLDVRSGQLSLEQSQNTYQDYFIRAPFDGVVGRVPAKVGDSGSGATIATLIANNKFATISLNEVDAAKVKEGEKAMLNFDAIDGLSIPAHVDSVDLIGTVTQGVVTYNVKVIFDADDPRINPGMSASAEITTDSKENVLMVPNSAVKTQNGNKYVEVAAGASGDNSFVGSSTAPVALRQVRVETGVSNDTETEIISGLSEGDRIVVRTITTSGGAAATQAPSIFGTGRPRAAGGFTGGTGAVGGAAASGGRGGAATNAVFVR